MPPDPALHPPASEESMKLTSIPSMGPDFLVSFVVTFSSGEKVPALETQRQQGPQ